MKKRALCPLSGVHLTIKPRFEWQLRCCNTIIADINKRLGLNWIPVSCLCHSCRPVSFTRECPPFFTETFRRWSGKGLSPSVFFSWETLIDRISSARDGVSSRFCKLFSDFLGSIAAWRREYSLQCSLNSPHIDGRLSYEWSYAVLCFLHTVPLGTSWTIGDWTRGRNLHFA